MEKAVHTGAFLWIVESLRNECCWRVVSCFGMGLRVCILIEIVGPPCVRTMEGVLFAASIDVRLLRQREQVDASFDSPVWKVARKQ